MLVKRGATPKEQRANETGNFWESQEGRKQWADWQHQQHSNQSSLNAHMKETSKDPSISTEAGVQGWLDNLANRQPTRISRRFAKSYRYNKQTGQVEQIN